MERDAKQRYYVSVQAETILQGQGEAAYEFEIDATNEDIIKLQEMFEDKSDSTDSTFFRAHIPIIPYHHDRENDVYDDNLSQIYQFLHKLGTESTKKHIEAMGVLPQ